MLTDYQTILVCPLDWGLGHASRCVPIIKKLTEEGKKVIVGADKAPLSFLQKEFPEIETIVVPGQPISYSAKGSSLKLFCEAVKFYRFIKKEHLLLDKIIEEKKIDCVVSDNRYGLYSKKIKSIIITHQIFPKTPVGEGYLTKKISKLLDKFNEVWVPDYEGEKNLSGELSHNKNKRPKNLKYIGPLSRFDRIDSSKIKEYKYDVCAIVSGPEPQRSIFEKEIEQAVINQKLRVVFFRGKPESVRTAPHANIKVFNHASTGEMQKTILQSKLIVCRSGYSSIMDLTLLSKNAILVATPGQYEQEYLANLHKNNPLFLIQKQGALNIKKAITNLTYNNL